MPLENRLAVLYISHMGVALCACLRTLPSHPADRLVCYVTGISRFMAVLEAESEVYEDTAPIWSEECFPVRFKVRSLVQVPYEKSVAVLGLRDRLQVFEGLVNPNRWSGPFRGSPHVASSLSRS